VLLFVATDTELQQLSDEARSRGLQWDEQTSELGQFWTLGQVGTYRVSAVRTKIGGLGVEGSGRNALYYMSATKAASLVCLGMAFGISRSLQSHGDVLVAERVFPYDIRKVVPARGLRRFLPWGGGPAWAYDYARTTTYSAKKELTRVFSEYELPPNAGFKVHFGCLLTGSARIGARPYRDEIIKSCINVAPRIIGGEMEAVGFLPLDKPRRARWILVKGISDFADQQQSADANRYRTQACANAASFVLGALSSWRPR
jgi:nucleoside phosphorylase